VLSPKSDSVHVRCTFSPPKSVANNIAKVLTGGSEDALALEYTVIGAVIQFADLCLPSVETPVASQAVMISIHSRRHRRSVNRVNTST
jgi:hypothetical protein